MASSSNTPRRRIFQLGLVAKLLASTVLVFALVTVVTSIRATTQLESDLTTAFESKGEAIALAMAAAAERSAKGDPLIVQNSIEANRRLHGVSYIYVQDASGHVYGSTIVGELPEGVRDKNKLVAGNTDGESVKMARVTYAGTDGSVRAIDVAAPVARATLGSVHVGMDRDVIDGQVAKLRSSMYAWSAVAALLGMLALLAVVIFAVIRPIKELTRITSDIVAKGDLTQKIEIRSNDEIGQLANSFARLVERLREIPTSVRASTRLVSDSVTQLTSSASAQNQTVSRQAAALQETQVTAQEIKQTSLLASQKADAVLKFAERAEAVSQDGKTAVQQSVTALRDIRAQVEEIAERITALGERTLQIGDVTQTVKDLADQSNMLALNAAIEAARSGEHGKGFAVVAREIRRLADQSIQATKRVRENLEEISGAAREAVSITEKGTQKIDSSLELAKASGERFAELSGIVIENSAAARQIGAAVGQQNAGIAQIFGAVTEQSLMMDETVKRLQGTEKAVAMLKDASEKLVDIVEQFQV